MSIEFQCPSCAKKLKVKDELAGKRVKCPGCGNAAPAPARQATSVEDVVQQARAKINEAALALGKKAHQEMAARAVEAKVNQRSLNKKSLCAKCGGVYQWPDSFKHGPIPIPAEVIDKPIYCPNCDLNYCIQCVCGKCPVCGATNYKAGGGPTQPVDAGTEEVPAATAPKDHLKLAEDLASRGNHAMALSEFEQAIAYLQGEAKAKPDGDLNDLAKAYVGKCLVLTKRGDLDAVAAIYEQALPILERAFHEQRHGLLAQDLASAYFYKAMRMSGQGDHRGAVPIYDKGIAIFERLVHKKGKTQLRTSLGLIYVQKGGALGMLREWADMREASDQAIVFLKELVDNEGHAELRGDLGQAMVHRAFAVWVMGDRTKAKPEMAAGAALLQAEIARLGRTELQTTLDMALTRLRYG